MVKTDSIALIFILLRFLFSSRRIACVEASRPNSGTRKRGESWTPNALSNLKLTNARSAGAAADPGLKGYLFGCRQVPLFYS